eukprot:917282-Prymnesium_polylepis.1
MPRTHASRVAPAVIPATPALGTLAGRRRSRAPHAAAVHRSGAARPCASDARAPPTRRRRCRPGGHRARLGLHDAQADGGRLPAALGDRRVRRRRARCAFFWTRPEIRARSLTPPPPHTPRARGVCGGGG